MSCLLLNHWDIIGFGCNNHNDYTTLDYTKLLGHYLRKTYTTHHGVISNQGKLDLPPPRPDVSPSGT